MHFAYQCPSHRALRREHSVRQVLKHGPEKLFCFHRQWWIWHELHILLRFFVSSWDLQGRQLRQLWLDSGGS